MVTKELFVWLSGVFSAGAYIPYVIAIIRFRGSLRPVRPQRASWFVYWVIDTAMVWALKEAGSEGADALPMFVAFSIGSGITFLLSLKWGEGGFSKQDIFCVTIALLGVAIWRLFALENPEVSIVANLMAAVAGTIPTIEKAYHNPESEDILTWCLFMAGGFFGCLGVKEWTFVALTPPVAVFFLQMGINSAIVLGRRRKRLLACQ